MGVLLCGWNGSTLEDRGCECGDEAEVEPGMRVKKVARIVQCLLGMAKAKNKHWAQHAEEELNSEWPGLEKHWKK
jgi:hypothetical protein